MTHKFKAIVFDMDGLLVDSEVVWQRAEEDLFGEYGLAYTDAVREQVVGLRLDEFFEKLIAIFNLDQKPETLGDDLIRRMLTLIPQQVVAQPGAQAMIDYVLAENVPHCIASSSPMSIIDAIVASQGWGDAFPIRLSADDDVRGKPAPDVYLRACQTLGFEPSECLALEDSTTGSRAAVAAGMTCYAVPDTSHTDPTKFADITPHVFDSLHDVLTHLKSL